MTRRGWALFAAMALIWGVPYLLIKIAVADLTPITLVFLRSRADVLAGHSIRIEIMHPFVGGVFAPSAVLVRSLRHHDLRSLRVGGAALSVRQRRMAPYELALAF